MGDKSAKGSTTAFIMRNIEESLDGANIMAMEMTIHAMEAVGTGYALDNDEGLIREMAARGLVATREMSRLMCGI